MDVAGKENRTTTHGSPCILHPKPGSKVTVREGLWIALKERLSALWLPLGLGVKLSVCPSSLQAQQAKFLSDAENELQELAVTITQAKKMVELIKVTLQCLSSGSAALLGWGWRKRGCEILGCVGCKDGPHRSTMNDVILAEIPEDSFSSSLLTLLASLVALVFNMEEGTGQGPCQGILWLLHLVCPGSWGGCPLWPLCKHVTFLLGDTECGAAGSGSA